MAANGTFNGLVVTGSPSIYVICHVIGKGKM